MASIITENIPSQNFEIVLNKIGVILLEELTNQKELKSFESEFEVYTERQEPYDKGEDVVIVLSCNNINYSGLNSKDSQGNTIFFIDVYASGTESIDETGNDLVRHKIHLFSGMIRYILSSTKYKMLGFERGFIGGQSVDSIQYDDNYGRQDGSFIRMCRITFSVRIQENQDMWTPIPLLVNNTSVKMNSTDKGFKLIFNN